MADDSHSTEEWRVINEAPDYAVSSLGRIKRVRADCLGRHLGRIMRPNLTCHGYLDVQLQIDGAPRHFGVHVLVCAAFNGPKPTPKHQVRHLDGDSVNNLPENLAWGTGKENAQDAITHGTKAKGVRHGRAILTDENVAYIRQSSESTRTLGRKFGVGNTCIQKVRTGENWAHRTGS